MSDTLFTASVVIRSPLLDVFDYVADPRNLPQWVPFYAEVTGTSGARPSKGDRFTAKLSYFSPLISAMQPFGGMLSAIAAPSIDVCVDDIVHGRRIAYRSSDVGCTTICDFEPSAGRTIFTLTHSLWSLPSIAMSYWLGDPLSNDILRRVLEGLRRRLEGRAVEPQPKIFFSYRRSKARYVGGRIFDALTSEFGEGTVFRDSNSLLAGGDWSDDIHKAIRQCKVVVVHIGDGWETTLKDQAAGDDGLRDELEAALDDSDNEGRRGRIVPVLTTEDDSKSAYQRMAEIEREIQVLRKRAPRLCKKFTARTQVQRLREDPDFGRDLEHLMRAVWTEFRAS